MNRFSLASLLITVGVVSVLLGVAMHFPGPVILLLSFAPLSFIFWRVRPSPGPRKELKLIALVAFAVIPPYIAIGPLVAGAST